MYEPIPYRTALAQGATHVLVLRSYPGIRVVRVHSISAGRGRMGRDREAALGRSVGWLSRESVRRVKGWRSCTSDDEWQAEDKVDSWWAEGSGGGGRRDEGLGGWEDGGELA